VPLLVTEQLVRQRSELAITVAPHLYTNTASI